MNDKAPLHLQETILTGDEYVNSLLADIKHAKKTIDLESYIFNEDNFGKKIINALITAAERGVKIRLLFDGIGTSSWYEGFRKLEEVGVQIRIFNPFPLKLWQLNRTYF